MSCNSCNGLYFELSAVELELLQSKVHPDTPWHHSRLFYLGCLKCFKDTSHSFYMINQYPSYIIFPHLLQKEPSFVMRSKPLLSHPLCMGDDFFVWIISNAEWWKDPNAAYRADPAKEVTQCVISDSKIGWFDAWMYWSPKYWRISKALKLRHFHSYSLFFVHIHLFAFICIHVISWFSCASKVNSL